MGNSTSMSYLKNKWITMHAFSSTKEEYSILYIIDIVYIIYILYKVCIYYIYILLKYYDKYTNTCHSIWKVMVIRWSPQWTEKRETSFLFLKRLERKTWETRPRELQISEPNLCTWEDHRADLHGSKAPWIHIQDKKVI